MINKVAAPNCKAPSNVKERRAVKTSAINVNGTVKTAKINVSEATIFHKG